MKALSLLFAATLVAAGAMAPASAAEDVGAASVADQMTRVRIIIRNPDSGDLGCLTIRHLTADHLVAPLPLP
jgi:hypothetical protein